MYMYVFMKMYLGKSMFDASKKSFIDSGQTRCMLRSRDSGQDGAAEQKAVHFEKVRVTMNKI